MYLIEITHQNIEWGQTQSQITQLFHFDFIAVCLSSMNPFVYIITKLIFHYFSTYKNKIL